MLFGLFILCHAICYTLCKGRRESNPAVRTVAPNLRLFPVVGKLPACVDEIARDDLPELRVFDIGVILRTRIKNAIFQVSSDLCASPDASRLHFCACVQ